MNGQKIQRTLPLLLATLISSFAASPSVRAQAAYPATRAADLQAGGFFSFGRSNYLPSDTQGNPAPLSDLTRTLNLRGGGAYAALDFSSHLGAEFDFRHVGAAGQGNTQTTYELGARYSLFQKRRFHPFVRLSYGRGTYVYDDKVATLSFNLIGVSGGTDFALSRAFNLRAEYEWQDWLSVPLRKPSPQVVSLGIAYHFH